MSIVTISRGSYTRGREVAEKLGQRLGYDVISREVLISTSKEFNIPEVKLKNALYNAPSILDRFSYGKEKYLAFIRANILEHMVKDNTIYHGLGGHAFMQNIGHELNVRIRADFEDRVQRFKDFIEKEKGEKISEEEAKKRLCKDDEERHKWSVHITGTDPCDPSNYDVIYNASKFKVDDIVENIVQLLQLPYLQTTEESQNKLEQITLAAQTKIAIVDDFPNSNVTCWDNIAYINVNADLSQEEEIRKQIKNKTAQLKGVKEVRVHVAPHLIS